MKARVIHFNEKQGYYSATTENRVKVVFNLFDSGELKLEDVLVGNFDSSGVQLVTNETRQTQLKIDIKEFHKIGAPFRGHG